MRCSRSARSASFAKQSSNSRRNTWADDFAWTSRVSGPPEHCLDVPLVFDVLADPAVEPALTDGAAYTPESAG